MKAWVAVMFCFSYVICFYLTGKMVKDSFEAKIISGRKFEVMEVIIQCQEVKQ